MNPMKTFKIYAAIALSSLLLLAPYARAQTATTSTTLSAAVTAVPANTLFLASATNVVAGGYLYTDGEVYQVGGSYSSGTTVPVLCGQFGTNCNKHLSGATVFVFTTGVQARAGLVNRIPVGACTRSDYAILPRIAVQTNAVGLDRKYDCFGGQWYYTDAVSGLYSLTIAPGAQPSASSPAAGVAVSITGQPGGAQSATTSNGAAGAAITETGGVGGAGGSSSGTGGAGGAVGLIGGAGGGTITGGAGGAATVKGGAGGNGSSAGGNGGDVSLIAGAVGTGGTGAAGKVKVKDPADNTKVIVVDPSNSATASTTTVATNATASRTVSLPDFTGTVTTAVDCGATTGNANCANTVAAATVVNPRIYLGKATLASNAAIITFGTAFTSTATYSCVANDVTTRANPVQMVQTSSATATITNTTGASDVIQYICVGY